MTTVLRACIFIVATTLSLAGCDEKDDNLTTEATDTEGCPDCVNPPPCDAEGTTSTSTTTDPLTTTMLTGDGELTEPAIPDSD